MTARHLSSDLDGYTTDVLIQTFADRVFVLVTQLGKVGTLIQASIPDRTPLPTPSNPEQHLPVPPAAIQLTTLFGSSPTEHLRTLYAIYASQIATLIWIHNPTGIRKSVIVGLALGKSNAVDEEQERNTFRGVMMMVHSLLQNN